MPFSPFVDLLLQVLRTEGFDFIVHTTGLWGRGHCPQGLGMGRVWRAQPATLSFYKQGCWMGTPSSHSPAAPRSYSGALCSAPGPCHLLLQLPPHLTSPQSCSSASPTLGIPNHPNWIPLPGLLPHLSGHPHQGSCPDTKTGASGALSGSTSCVQTLHWVSCFSVSLHPPNHTRRHILLSPFRR